MFGLFGRGTPVAPTPAVASTPAVAASPAAPVAPAAPAAAPAAPARTWGNRINYLKQGTLFNTKRVQRALAARNAAQVPYNAAVAANSADSTNTTKKTLKNTKNVLRKARETYAAELRASKKKGNNTANANAANAAAAELIESKDASSKFFDTVLNPNGSALNRYFKRGTDFQIFDRKEDMKPGYINNETIVGYTAYSTGRNTNKKNTKEYFTDRKETIESYKLVGTKILLDEKTVYIRMFGLTEHIARENLQFYISELKNSLAAEKKSAEAWAQRRATAAVAGRGVYTAGLGLVAAPLAATAAAVAAPLGAVYGTGALAKGAFKYGLKPAAECVGAACGAVYDAATSSSALAKLTERVDVLSGKIDTLSGKIDTLLTTAGAAATPAGATGTPAGAPVVAAPAGAALSATAALASGATPAIDFTAVLNTVTVTSQLNPNLRAALETAGVAEDKRDAIVAAALQAWDRATGGIDNWRVAAAAAAQAALNAPTAGGRRRPSRRHHKKHTMMTRSKKSVNKKH